MAMIKLFAAIREVAGISEDEIEAPNIEEILAIAIVRYGSTFEQSLPFCKIAVNGSIIDKSKYGEVHLKPSDEVAFLPPVSGG